MTRVEVTSSLATVQFSRVAGARPTGLVSRSLKTQQHAPAKAPRYVGLAGPGPVDILGRTVGGPPLALIAEVVTDDNPGHEPATAPCRTGPHG